MTDTESNLDAIIANAVEAKIETAVATALAGDEMMGRYVTAALQQQVSATNDRYDREKTTFLNKVIADAVRAATKKAVEKYLIEEVELLETHVRKELKKATNTIAAELVKALSETAEKAYGVSVKLDIRGRG